MHAYCLNPGNPAVCCRTGSLVLRLEDASRAQADGRRCCAAPDCKHSLHGCTATFWLTEARPSPTLIPFARLADTSACVCRRANLPVAEPYAAACCTVSAPPCKDRIDVAIAQPSGPGLPRLQRQHQPASWYLLAMTAHLAGGSCPTYGTPLVGLRPARQVRGDLSTIACFATAGGLSPRPVRLEAAICAAPGGRSLDGTSYGSTALVWGRYGPITGPPALYEPVSLSCTVCGPLWPCDVTSICDARPACAATPAGWHQQLTLTQAASACTACAQGVGTRSTAGHWMIAGRSSRYSHHSE